MKFVLSDLWDSVSFEDITWSGLLVLVGGQRCDWWHVCGDPYYTIPWFSSLWLKMNLKIGCWGLCGGVVTLLVCLCSWRAAQLFNSSILFQWNRFLLWSAWNYVILFVPCLSIATFLTTFSSSFILSSLHLFCFWSLINNCVDPILYVYFKNDFSIMHFTCARWCMKLMS